MDYFKTDHIEMLRGDKTIRIIYSKSSNKSLDYYLKDINLTDYPFIYKSSAMQKQVSIDDLFEFKYAGYLLSKLNLDEFLNYMKEVNISIPYLTASTKFEYFIENFDEIKKIITVYE